MNSLKFIGAWTIGMMGLDSATRETIEAEFNKQSQLKDDWFYCIKVNGNKYFVADNGQMGYTAMLPEEY